MRLMSCLLIVCVLLPWCVAQRGTVHEASLVASSNDEFGQIHRWRADLLETGAPDQYQDLYAMLDSKLGSILSHVNSRWDGEIYNVNYAAELISANGHRGEELLKPECIEGVALMLDQLKSLRVKGVKVAVKYPLLMPDFPNSNGYLDFYRRVSQAVRDRKLVLYVATTTAFRDPAFTSLNVDYSGLTFKQFKQDMRWYVETVLGNLRPDYLTFTNEPQSQVMNTGLDFSVKNVKELVEYVLDGLDHKGALIGAGAGTWDKIEYFESLAEISGLDYLDMHIYPINADFVIDRTIRIAEIAKAHNKKLVLGEAWLYKVRDRELGAATATSAQLFARDVFSFWAPLDEKFLEAIVKLSHLLRIDFCSFFWMQYFYSYLQYDEEKNAMKPAQLFALVNGQAAKNILSNKLSSTGIKYKSLIASLSYEPSSFKKETTETMAKLDPRRHPLISALAIAAISAVVIGAVIYSLRRRR